jgi:hypothetical protein
MFGRTLLLLLPPAERFPACGRLVVELLTVVVGLLTTVLVVVDLFTTVLVVTGLLTTVLVERLVTVLPIDEREVDELLVTALPIDEREVDELLVTTALLFGEAVATLRLPAAAALEVVAGRRPWAIAPVDVMASPHASIKPIIVL